MKLVLILMSFLVTQLAYGYDPQKCFKVVHADGLIKYDFPGYLSSEYMTKKYGTTTGVSEYTKQSSTSLIDPFVSTGQFTSTTQFTSSDGGCSYYSYNREMRHDYFERNAEYILEQIAMGQGEHLKSIYYYSSCQDGGMMLFKAQLQKSYEALHGIRNTDALLEKIDDLIQSHATLKKLCQVG